MIGSVPVTRPATSVRRMSMVWKKPYLRIEFSDCSMLPRPCARESRDSFGQIRN